MSTETEIALRPLGRQAWMHNHSGWKDLGGDVRSPSSITRRRSMALQRIGGRCRLADLKDLALRASIYPDYTMVRYDTTLLMAPDHN